MRRNTRATERLHVCVRVCVCIEVFHSIPFIAALLLDNITFQHFVGDLQSLIVTNDQLNNHRFNSFRQSYVTAPHDSLLLDGRFGLWKWCAPPDSHPDPVSPSVILIGCTCTPTLGSPSLSLCIRSTPFWEVYKHKSLRLPVSNPCGLLCGYHFY